MKQLVILFLTVAAAFSFTQCGGSPANQLANASDRGKTISALMNNGAYMAEVMDSMKVKHGGDMTKHDHAMQADMMDKVITMCKMDPAACKIMMDKTCAMCEADQSKCDMMMGSMGGSPKMMSTMHEMCDMKGMKMDKKK